MPTLDLTRAICLQGCELAMWSAYWCYIVGIVDVGRFGWCARCKALGLLVSLACFVGGIKNTLHMLVVISPPGVVDSLVPRRESPKESSWPKLRLASILEGRS